MPHSAQGLRSKFCRISVFRLSCRKFGSLAVRHIQTCSVSSFRRSVMDGSVSSAVTAT